MPYTRSMSETRNELMASLKAANVEFDEEATILQLRKLVAGTKASGSASNASSHADNHMASGSASNTSYIDEFYEEEVRVDRELALARKKRELMLLQSEINTAVDKRIDLGVLDAMMTKFDGSDLQDIVKWVHDLENVFDIFRYSERDKLVAARHLMSGHAKRFTEIITACTYNALKEALLGEFKRAFTLQDVFNQLKARTLKRDETPRQYIVEMQHIASRSDIPDSDLIDLIIEGLNDKSSHTAMLYGATTIGQLKILMERYEKKRRANLYVKNPAVLADGSNAKTKVNSVKPEPAAVRCYNCSGIGHYQSACTAPKRLPNSCFFCGEVGHNRNNCPKKNRLQKASDLAALIMEADDADVELLTNQLAEKNLVSVAFFNQDKCTESIFFLALFDTGSPISVIRKSSIPFTMKTNHRPTIFRGMGNKILNTYGTIECEVIFKQHKLRHKFIILPDDEALVPVLIGRDLLNKMHIGLCQFNKKKIFYTKTQLNELNIKAQLPMENVLSAVKLFDLLKNPMSNVKVPAIDELNFVQNDDILESGVSVIRSVETKELLSYSEVIMLVGIDTADCDSMINVDEKLNMRDAEVIRSIIKENYLNMEGKSEKFKGYVMKILLKNDTPVYSSPRKLSYNEKLEVQRTIDDLLEQGIIQPSASPYASPIVLVRKKNGKLRMCVDYRSLNKLTVRDHFPLPLIEDCLEYLGGKNFFSTLDLKNGFHQVPMHEDSVPLTAFVTPMGQYEYLFMPFGLTNAPPVFQRFINLVLGPLIEKGEIVVYLDDINIATKTIEEHFRVLTKVLLLLSEAGLKLNLEKCQFAYDELEYLGYCVNSEGIRPNKKHLEVIMNYPVPTNTKEVQRAIGLFSYFRRFVYNFSRIAAPLNRLIQKEAKFEWTDECMNAFLVLKNKLISPPILSIFDPKRETELHTDASSRGYGAVLMQKQDDLKFHPIAYYSRTTTDAESRYHSFELETLAIVRALDRFRTFLDGIVFVIVTDCNSLVLTLDKKLINPRIARWALGFANYNFTVRHRKGDQMQHVDALSRVPAVCAIEEGEVDLNIQIIQARDPIIKQLKDKLEKSNIDGYELENGLVFRVGDHCRQLYVPGEMEENIMRLIHETYGHLGVDKCAHQIQKHYWFPSMRSKLDKFIKNCLKCIYYSAPTSNNQRNLYTIPKEPVPWDTLHIDHFGPLATINSKHKHILVVVDSFTKFVKLYAVNTGTKETICALKRYFIDYSRPRRIISDQGSCFTSREFVDFCKENNICHVLNAVASPQSNGQVERVNRVIKAILAKVTDPIEHADWKEKLSYVEFAVNNTEHCATKETPSKLLFGVEQRGEIVNEFTEYLDNFAKSSSNLDEIRAQADLAIQKSQLDNERYFAQKHKPAKEFKVGDLVVVKNVDTTIGKNKKLICKYRGPYVIRKYLGNDRYIVSDVDNCQITQIPYNNIVDSSRIKKWLEPRSELTSMDSKGNTDVTLNDDSFDYCINYEYLDDEQV